MAGRAKAPKNTKTPGAAAPGASYLGDLADQPQCCASGRAEVRAPGLRRTFSLPPLPPASLRFAPVAASFGRAGPITPGSRRMLPVQIAPAIRLTDCSVSHIFQCRLWLTSSLRRMLSFGCLGAPCFRLAPSALRPGQTCLLLPACAFRSIFAWTGGQPSTFTENQSPTRPQQRFRLAPSVLRFRHRLCRSLRLAPTARFTC